jgi:hypothetical protein
MLHSDTARIELIIFCWNFGCAFHSNFYVQKKGFWVLFEVLFCLRARVEYRFLRQLERAKLIPVVIFIFIKFSPHWVKRWLTAQILTQMLWNFSPKLIFESQELNRAVVPALIFFFEIFDEFHSKCEPCFLDVQTPMLTFEGNNRGLLSRKSETESWECLRAFERTGRRRSNSDEHWSTNRYHRRPNTLTPKQAQNQGFQTLTT